MPGPPLSVTSSKRPFCKLRYRYLCSAYFKSALDLSTSGYTWPFDIRMSSHPSLSMSKKPTPQPSSRVLTPRPLGWGVGFFDMDNDAPAQQPRVDSQAARISAVLEVRVPQVCI